MKADRKGQNRTKKPRRGNKWRAEWERKTKGQMRTHGAGLAVFCSTRSRFRERDTLRTSHNAQPPTVSHHVHFIEDIFHDSLRHWLYSE